MLKEVVVLLPALDEVEGIRKTIQEVPIKMLLSQGYRTQIVLADSGSSDGTPELVESLGHKVIKSRRGKGRTIRDALKALEPSFTFLFLLDSDYTYPPIYIPLMLNELERTKSDVVIGSRLKGIREEGSMSDTHFIGNIGLTYIANKLFSTPISDLCTGYWGFRKGTIMKLRLTANHFDLEANLYTELDRLGSIITEVPILYRRRSSEPTKLKWQDGLKIAGFLLKEKVTRSLGWD